MPQLRPVTHADIETIAQIETECFPPKEAASLTSFQKRFAVFSECFYLLEVDGEIVGHINGCMSDHEFIYDELFEDASLHQPTGKFQTIFGLAVSPDFQRKGYASLLLKHFIAASQQRDHLVGMTLTCKEHLIGFYERHGFVLRGESASAHGGAKWYDMTLEFGR